MQPGRCITGDYGHVMGCYADVTAYVSDMCNYRQNCTLLVATMDSVAQPCAKDFKSYLQAYYVCVRGIHRVSVTKFLHAISMPLFSATMRGKICRMFVIASLRHNFLSKIVTGHFLKPAAVLIQLTVIETEMAK